MESKASEEGEGEGLNQRIKKAAYSYLLNKLPGFKDFTKKKIFEENLFGLEWIHIINNLMGMNECAVQDVMVQRSGIVALGMEDADLLNKALSSNHTRIPVFKDNIDNIVGFVHIKDIILNVGSDFNVKDILHNVMYVPHSMKVVNLFVKMQSSRIHMAVVLDEYGSTDGIVTMADIIEGIVGDIEDEHDITTIPDIVNVSEDKIEVSARVLVRTLEQSLGIVLRDQEEEEEYVTVGGLIFAMVGRVPAVNEVFHHKSGAVFLIKEADNRCIYRVIIDLGKVKQANHN